MSRRIRARVEPERFETEAIDMGGGGGHGNPNADVMHAMSEDRSALDRAIESARGAHYPNPPQAGLNQTSIENSRAIGEAITWTDARDVTKAHTIDDINVVQTKDGTTWGYVYHTTDGHLWIQQDQNSKGQGSIGIPLPFGGSLGYSPAPATHPEPLMDVSQLPPQSHVQPSPLLRGNEPASRLLVPESPHQHLHDALMKRDGADHSEINNWGVTPFDPKQFNVSQALGNPAVGSYALVTPNGAQTIERGQPAIERA